MTHHIILCADQVFLRKGIKNWIEMHSEYKVTHEAGSWEECEQILDFIASMRAALPAGADTVTGEPSGYIAIVDISFNRKLIYKTPQQLPSMYAVRTTGGTGRKTKKLVQENTSVYFPGSSGIRAATEKCFLKIDGTDTRS